jgi:Carboxypeptidase regulatory-like domain
MRVLRILLEYALLAVACSVLAVAQTGSIQGTVTDTSGALVQGAEITARHVATNASRTVTSSGGGAYSITDLPVGLYEITAKKDNFKAFKVSRIELTVAQVLAVNIRLQPGPVSERMDVKADLFTPIDLETSQVSNLVGPRQMQDLPLITRDPYSLVLLSPGTSQTNTSLGGFTVNGSRERNNNFLLDGVDNNDTSVPGIPGGVLTAHPDSTEEFRIITNNFNPEFGRNTGAIIDVVTKSGSNNLHGGAYWFGRYNPFGGARDWFNPAIDAAGKPEKMNPYVRNQFGYSMGGPIRKDKTFFFFNEEFERFRTTLTNALTAPTAAFKTGVFNYTAPNSAGQLVTVPVDLSPTGANNAFGAPLDPTMQQILALYPTPLQSADGMSGTVFYPSASKQDSYDTVVKIDHRIADQHALNLRYGYDHFLDPDHFHDEVLPGGIGATAEKAINQGALANLTSTFRPTLINTFSFGWNRIQAGFNCTGLGVLDSVSPRDAFGNTRDYFMNPFTSFGCTTLVSDGQWRKTGTTSYTDYISWVKGSHTLKFGFDFRNIAEQGPNNFYSRRQLDTRTFSFGGFSLISNTQANPPINPPSNDTPALEDAASALYGVVWSDFYAQFFDKSGVRKGTDNKQFRQHEYDGYAQDSWKVRSNLTLSLGVRYQLDGVPYEENANFSNLLTNPASSPVVFSIVGPGTGRQLYQPDYSNIEPRVGFSWDPFKDGKTAIRGAFGVYHDRVFGNLFGNARGNPPFEQDYQKFPYETVNNAFGSGFPAIVPNTVPSTTVANGSYLSPIVFDTHFRNAASNNWNFGMQHELPGNNSLDLAYVGSKGTHIYRQVDGNPPDPNLVNQLVAFCSNKTNSFGCKPSTVSSIFLYEGADFGLLPFNAVAHNALVQPFYQRSVGNSIYHSLQTKFTHRMSRGLQMQGSYTWAHGIDDSSDPLNPAAGNRTFPRNSLNLAQDRGNSDNDIRHNVVINYIWELPLGKGKGYLNSGALGRIFEGMQFSGITSVQTGHPFEIRCSRDSQRTGINAWCDLVGDPFASGTNDTAGSLGEKAYFGNPAAFATPAWGRAGTIGRNQFYGPGYVNFDMAFTKRIRFTERVNVETRFEGYNIFNHPHFLNPGNLFGSPTFGLVTAIAKRPDSTTSARQLQLGMKLNF